MVKQKVTAIKNLDIVMRDMEPWIKNPKFLYVGRKGNIRLLPREILANWLLCAVANSADDNKSITFCNDPFGGGDGIIIDRDSEEQMVTEHIFIPKHQKNDSESAEDLIFKAVEKKQKKGGMAYSEGKHLIIFCDGIGNVFPNKIGKRVHEMHDFLSIWVIGIGKIECENIYKYWVTQLARDYSPACEVVIDYSTKKWSVNKIQ